MDGKGTKTTGLRRDDFPKRKENSYDGLKSIQMDRKRIKRIGQRNSRGSWKVIDP